LERLGLHLEDKGLAFYEEYYRLFREELIRYAWRFDRSIERAEDLFEDCHSTFCNTYSGKTQVEYLKTMKDSMRNLHFTWLNREGLVAKYSHPESLSPKPLIALEEYVCKSAEVELLMLAMARLSQADREILLGDKNKETDERAPRYRAKKRLEQKLIEVVADQKHPPAPPDCPYCFSPTLYFMLDQLLWVCEKCGQVTKLPARNWEKNQPYLTTKEKGSVQP
jgi:ribosomal protein L37AE/L43A